jgi:hypothetical protein
MSLILNCFAVIAPVTEFDFYKVNMVMVDDQTMLCRYKRSHHPTGIAYVSGYLNISTRDSESI